MFLFGFFVCLFYEAWLVWGKCYEFTIKSKIQREMNLDILKSKNMISKIKSEHSGNVLNDNGVDFII